MKLTKERSISELQFTSELRVFNANLIHIFTDFLVGLGWHASDVKLSCKEINPELAISLVLDVFGTHAFDIFL